LPSQKKIIPEEKSNLHPRNPHRFRYNFPQLIKTYPALKQFVFVNEFGNETLDFSNADAVVSLNKSLLKQFYGISHWDIPKNYLCPPIPGRADYIHYAADLLASSNKNKIPTGNKISVLDIGVGANCIYPIIGNKEYGWKFIGTDVDPIAISSAKKIIEENSLTNIQCRLQTSSSNFFLGVIQSDEVFDISVCNPPFHASAEEAQAGTKRKWSNLKIKKDPKKNLNFGGQNAELWCEGGEELFVRKMITESAEIPQKCFWFTSLISKSSHLPAIYAALKKVNASEIKTIEMSQGQKKSRLVAWTFLNEDERLEWVRKRW
jgi:23S rRNA (adenine1618-N6)-methyltransferase